MNRLILVTAMAATALATAASAQPYDQQRSYNQQQQQYQQAVRENDQQQRQYQQARRRWERGQRLPSAYRSHEHMIGDYNSRGWRRPPRGYAYYSTDSGDVVMAAIATGLISSIIANDNHRDYDRNHR